MTNLLLDQIKKQTSSFLHEKYNNARMVFTDVTPAELLAEEATNNDPCSPNAKTMAKIADASFEIDDYWRIVDVLHMRLYNIDWKQWRQSYKSLVLLDFLLTHGPEEFAEDFLCLTNIIQDLSTFKYIDVKGFDWGFNMQQKSERILELLQGGDTLKLARLKAIRITNEIHGFGNMMATPPSSSSASSSKTSQSSSLASYSSTSSTWNNVDGLGKYDLLKKDDINVLEHDSTDGREEEEKTGTLNVENDVEDLHGWDSGVCVEEKGPLIRVEGEGEMIEKNGKYDDNDNDDVKVYERPQGFLSGVRSRFVCVGPLRRNNGAKVDFKSFSDVGKVKEKRFERQFSLQI